MTEAMTHKQKVKIVSETIQEHTFLYPAGALTLARQIVKALKFKKGRKK